MNDLPAPGTQRLFDVASRKGVALDIRQLPWETWTVEGIASALGVELGQVAHAIVFVAARSQYRVTPIVCLVSGRDQVDLELLAAVTGEGVLRRATAHELQDLVGQTEGATPPFGHGRDVRTVMDQNLGNYPWVWAAIGEDSGVLRLEPRTLRMLANAVVAPVARSSRTRSAAPVLLESALRLEASASAG